jgi:hypothetical protein
MIPGPRGTGKSYSALSLCKAIFPSLNRRCFIFSVEELIDFLNSEHNERGVAILYDEFGVDANVKKWQSSTNTAINYLMQTIRTYNLAIFFTAPSLHLIDSHTRNMFHFALRSERDNIDYQKKIAYFYPYFLSPSNDMMSNELYRHFPVIGFGDEAVSLTQMGITIPPEAVVKEYEIARREYVTRIGNEQQKIMQVKKGWFKPTDIERNIENVLKNIDNYSIRSGKLNSPKLRLDLIANREHLGANLARRVMAEVKRRQQETVNIPLNTIEK